MPEGAVAFVTRMLPPEEIFLSGYIKESDRHFVGKPFQGGQSQGVRQGYKQRSAQAEPAHDSANLLVENLGFEVPADVGFMRYRTPVVELARDRARGVLASPP